MLEGRIEGNDKCSSNVNNICFLINPNDNKENILLSEWLLLSPLKSVNHTDF